MAFPGRELYDALGGGHQPIYHQRAADGGGAGLLKRSMAEMERQQLLHHALFLRSVKHKSLLHASPVVDLLSDVTSSSSSLSSSSPYLLPSNFARAPRQQNGRSLSDLCVSAGPKPDAERSSAMQNRLQELERQLLGDEEEDEASVVSAGSAVTNSEWSDAVQQLISGRLPPPAKTQVPFQNPVSPSPTTSSSSTSSSSASCSPTSSTPSSRQLIADTATAIAEGNLELATANITTLKRSANPRGDPEQRLTAYMVGSLLSRMKPPLPGGLLAPELCTPEHLAATQLLLDTSPVFKFALVAANYAILEANRDQQKIHIVDFDVRQGAQCASFIHALAEQNSTHRPPALKITAVCDPTFPFNASSGGIDLRIVGEKLLRLAEREGIALRFNIVRRRVAELDQATLGCEPGEALAVNMPFVLSRVADESVSPANPRDELLRRVCELRPSVVTLVEQEINTNTAPFTVRATEACAHYGALLESLDAIAARDSRERALVEACLGRRAANAVAREGADRVERCEVFGKWRARMGMAGFRPSPLGSGAAELVRSRLALSRVNPGFTLKEEAGGLALCWMGRVLTVASAWR